VDNRQDGDEHPANADIADKCYRNSYRFYNNSKLRPHPNPSPKERGFTFKVLSFGEDLGEVKI
jgi:hypothetical protein